MKTNWSLALVPIVFCTSYFIETQRLSQEDTNFTHAGLNINSIVSITFITVASAILHFKNF